MVAILAVDGGSGSGSGVSSASSVIAGGGGYSGGGGFSGASGASEALQGRLPCGSCSVAGFLN